MAAMKPAEPSAVWSALTIGQADYELITMQDCCGFRGSIERGYPSFRRPFGNNKNPP